MFFLAFIITNKLVLFAFVYFIFNRPVLREGLILFPSFFHWNSPFVSSLVLIDLPLIYSKSLGKGRLKEPFTGFSGLKQ